MKSNNTSVIHICKHLLHIFTTSTASLLHVSGNVFQEYTSVQMAALHRTASHHRLRIHLMLYITSECLTAL